MSAEPAWKSDPHWYDMMCEYRDKYAATDEEIASLRLKVEELERERDDALSRVEELESEAERVSAEFEGDCWKAMRSILTECNFDWRDVDPEGVTAEDAREYISTTLDELEKGERRFRDKAAALEDQNRALEAATIEKCAKVAEECWLTLAIADTVGAQEQINVCREEIAKAIRSLPRPGDAGETK